MSNCHEADTDLENKHKTLEHDILHALASLKLRINKLEQYAKYQDAINNKHYEKLDTLLLKFMKLDLAIDIATQVDKNICDFNDDEEQKPKTIGITFEEAATSPNNAKGIRRKKKKILDL